MKIKYGFVAIGAGLVSMLSGLALKAHCEKFGSTLFGFGLASTLFGSFSLLKEEGDIIPKQISIPMGDMKIEME